MMESKPNRRVERTRRLLRTALIELLALRRYDDLAVQDVLDRSGVGRATFYAHFRNKEDLFRATIDNLRNALVRHWEEEAAAGRAAPGELGFVLPFLKHVEASPHIWRALVGGEGAAIVDRQFRKMFAEMARRDLGVSRENSRDEARVQIIVGGLMALVNWWMDGGVSLTGEEVHAVFVDSIRNDRAGA